MLNGSNWKSYIIEIMIVFLILFSCVSFILFGVDKKKAVRHGWRIPEKTLLLYSVFGGIGGLLGMFCFHHKTRKWKFRILVPLFAFVEVILLAFFLWTSIYYHVGDAAGSAMKSDSHVSVEKMKKGWLFDGPSDDKILIFYPGAKVEETAYAPLLHKLASEQMDVYLVKMPFRLAFFGMNTADSVIAETSYHNYFIGGHSLGGAMAASYAAGHEEKLRGLVLLAAYPTDRISLDTVLIYGSCDGVLNMSRARDAAFLVSGSYDEYVIKGGNHAQFGDYGEQAGDGKAGITAEEQQVQTIRELANFIG